MPKKNSPGCGCCCRCKNSDVLLLVDTTGSMGRFIAQIKTLFNDLEEDFDDLSCFWSVVEYKDYEDGGDFETLGWSVLQTFTNDFELVKDAVNLLDADGGGDKEEQNYDALKNAGDQWETTLGGRTDPNFKRVILWAGDEPGWNGEIPIKVHTYPTQPEVITSLQDADIKVFALNIRFAGSGIDGSSRSDNLPQQATEIADATDGEVFHNVNNIEDVRDSLCKALRG